MKLALLAVIAATVAPAPADDVAAIRTARASYNAAIIARDVAGVRAAFIDDYKGLAGSGGELIAGGDAMAAYFARAFANPDFISFVRTPDVVAVAVPADRAMERGHWLGRRKTASSEARLHGEYLAIWVPVAGGWRLRSESFVTLSQSELLAQ